MKQKLLKSLRLRACMLVAVLCAVFTGTAWGAESVCYTLTPTSGSNNGYANDCDITIDGITWNLTGNSQQIPWRIGGKSLSNVDRTLYSKTAISDNVSKIEVTHGAANSITVNSWTVIVSKNADFSNPVSTLTPTFTQSETTTIQRPEDADWSNCYYKFVYNVTVSGSSNRFLEFSKAEFYSETSSTLEESDLAITDAPVALLFDLNNNASAQTVSFTTSSKGAVTVSESEYVTTSVSGNTITVTPVKVTPSVQTITISQAADDTYKAGTATFTISVDDSTPFEGGDVTFVATEDKGTSPLTKSGVSFACDNGILNNGSEYRLYKNSTTTISTTSGKITKIEFTGVSGNPVSGFGETIGLTTSGNNGTWTGNATSVSFTASDAQVRVSKIVVTVASADAVTVPVISGTTPFLGSTEVTITAEEDATIYYTTNGDEPSTSSTQYTAPFTLNTSATVKAIAVKDGKTSEVAEKAFEVVTPMTVAQALEATAPIEDVFVQGVVSTVTEVSTEHGNATYRISDDGTTEGEMIVYRGKYLNNVNFTDINQIQVGDVVVVAGKLTEYNGANQLAAGNYIVTLTTKQEPGIAYETTEYTVAPSATFETPELTNPHNLAVTYSISENEGVASIDATTGAVTIGTEEGSVTVTATFEGNDQYRAGSASYIIRVSDPNKGTEANPYTVADVIAGKADGKTEIYVIGYIVGEFNSKTQDPRTSDFTTDANIALADEFTKSPTAAASIPVALPTDDLKTTWGCKTNDGSTIGTKVLVKGNGETYFSVKGIKNTTEVNLVATISAAGYATFANAKAVDFSAAEGLTVLTAQYNKKTDKIDYTEVTSKKVPAGEAVVLKGAQGEYNGTVIASADALENNGLKVNLTENTPATGKEYCLANKNGVVGFYKVATTIYVKAGKAYLEIERTGSTGAKDFYAIDDETDGIRQIENGQSAIDNAEIYDLSGQRVNKAQKGIYIVNGKKVVVK